MIWLKPGPRPYILRNEPCLPPCQEFGGGLKPAGPAWNGTGVLDGIGRFGESGWKCPAGEGRGNENVIVLKLAEKVYKFKVFKMDGHRSTCGYVGFQSFFRPTAVQPFSLADFHFAAP